MFLESSPPDLLDFPFSNRWVDFFGLGIRPDFVLRPDGVWVPTASDDAAETLWVWDGSQYQQLPAPQDGPPTVDNSGIPTGPATPIADPPGRVIEFVGVQDFVDSSA